MKFSSILIIMLTLFSPATADEEPNIRERCRITKRFHDPRYGGYRVDWCKNWARNCGKPAADAFCRKKGYDSASDYPKDENVGVPTKISGHHSQVCDGPSCDGFKYIDCSFDTKYEKPFYFGYRLDWCKSIALACGKPAANAFCRYEGHISASKWLIDDDAGPTKTIGHVVCDAPSCVGFEYITCSG